MLSKYLSLRQTASHENNCRFLLRLNKRFAPDAMNDTIASTSKLILIGKMTLRFFCHVPDYSTNLDFVLKALQYSAGLSRPIEYRLGAQKRLTLLQ